MQKPGGTPYYWAAIVAIGGFLFGFDAVVISGVIGFISPQFNLTDVQIGTVVAAPSFAGIAATLAINPLADRFGRKRILLLLALLYAVSAIWSALATSFETLVIARAVGGFAFGSLGLAPIYISETAPAHKRGQLVSFNQFNIVLGFAVAYFSNYYILQLSQSELGWVQSMGIADNPWRFMLGLEAIPATIWLLALLTIPESPRWLALNGQTESARTVFGKLATAADAEKLLRDVMNTAEMATRPLLERIAQLANPRMKFVLIVGAVLATAQQITGINAVYFYAPSIFEQSGVGRDAAFAQAAMIGVTNVVVTIIAMLLVDRLGRRPLLMIGIVGVTLSMATISYGFSQARYQLDKTQIEALVADAGEDGAALAGLSVLADQEFTSDVAFKTAASEALGNEIYRASESSILQQATTLNAALILIGILAFVASFALSLGPVMWIMLPEIMPNSMRGVGMMATGLVNSVVSWGVQQFFPVMLGAWGSAAVFGTYAGFGLLFLALFWWIVPETKGKSLEQLEEELAPLPADVPREPKTDMAAAGFVD